MGLLHFVWVRRDGRKRPDPPATSESVGHGRRLGRPRAVPYVALAAGPLSRRRVCMSPEAHGGVRCPEETAGTLYTRGIVSEGLCTLLARTSVQTPVRTGPPVYKVGLCALGGTFRRDFVHCPKAGGDFVHLRHRFGGTLRTAGGDQCANPRPNRAASVQSRTLRTGAVRTGTRAMPRSPGIMVPRGNSGVISQEPTHTKRRRAPFCRMVTPPCEAVS